MLNLKEWAIDVKQADNKQTILRTRNTHSEQAQRAMPHHQRRVIIQGYEFQNRSHIIKSN